MGNQPLRVGSHNVGGLVLPAQNGRLQAAVRLWTELKLDVICLQETHHTSGKQTQLLDRGVQGAAARLGIPGWTVAAHALSTSSRSAGVAVLVRAGLQPRLQVIATPVHLRQADDRGGRLTQLSIRWGGHTIHLANIYMPTSQHQQLRRGFIGDVLAPMTAAAGEDEAVLWAGDFNYVDNPAMDSTAGPGGRAADQPVARDFSTGCHGMVDT